MSRTERCRHLPKKIHSKWAGVSSPKIVDGNAHNQHHETLVRERVEKLFGGPRPAYSVFDPKHGTHTTLIKDKKKTHYYNYATNTWGWDWQTLPGSWRKNPEYERWQRIEETVRQEVVKPAGSWHPYQRGISPGRSKKEGRSRGNRRYRHAVKQAIPKYDAEEDTLPEQDELYNIWDL